MQKQAKIFIILIGLVWVVFFVVYKIEKDNPNYFFDQTILPPRNEDQISKTETILIEEGNEIHETDSNEQNEIIKNTTKEPFEEKNIEESNEFRETGNVYEWGYADRGFGPFDEEIYVGDAIKFINFSSHGMWIASDPHPEHSLHPDFDQLSSGGEYIYVFKEAGEYPFHNHVIPEHNATIIVRAHE